MMYCESCGTHVNKVIPYKHWFGTLYVIDYVCTSCMKLIFDEREIK